jgi:hypothetical protein
MESVCPGAEEIIRRAPTAGEVKMRKIIFGVAALLIATTAAAPAFASGATSGGTKAPCDAKYYSDLVGQSIDAARSVSGSNYRLLPSGADRGQSDPRRMTIVYDRSNKIVEVACG